jgi:hypothetical protein
VTYRCWCGHFKAEHTFSVGCAGCDAGGKDIETIEHNYEPDKDWPEGEWCELCQSYGNVHDPELHGINDFNVEGQPEFNGAFR